MFGLGMWGIGRQERMRRMFGGRRCWFVRRGWCLRWWRWELLGCGLGGEFEFVGARRARGPSHRGERGIGVTRVSPTARADAFAGSEREEKASARFGRNDKTHRFSRIA